MTKESAGLTSTPSLALFAPSTRSVFSHLAWTQVPRNKGGLGKMEIPLIGDIDKAVSEAYGMVVQAEGDDMKGACRARGERGADGRRSGGQRVAAMTKFEEHWAPKPWPRHRPGRRCG